MDHRERVLTAVNHQEPDRVPMAVGGSAYGITDPLYFDLLKHFNLGDPVLPFRPQMGHSINYLDDRILEALDIDTRYVWLGFTDLAGPPPGGGIDAWGVSWKKAGPYMSPVSFPLLEVAIDDLAKRNWPTVEKLVRPEELRQRARYLKEQTSYAVVGRAFDSYGPLERCNSLRRMDQFMMDLAMDPDFAKALIAQVSDVLARLLAIYLDAAGPYLDIIELPGDDYAAKKPLISPAMFDEFFAPVWRRLIGMIREANPACKILFHSDGRMAPFLGRLSDLGVDIFHCLETFSDEPELVDLAAVKQEFGNRLCFWGAIDIKQTMPGSKEGIEAEVRERIRLLAPGGGYVVAPANHLQPDVPVANVLTLFNAVREYGRYPLS